MMHKITRYISICFCIGLFVGAGSFGNAIADELSPLAQVTSIAADDSRSFVFAINADNSLSAYDLQEKKFILSRVAIPGLSTQKHPSLFISPDGSFLAILSSAPAYVQIQIFATADVLAHKLVSLASYTFPTQSSADARLLFSSDGNTLYFKYARIFAFLSTAKSDKQELVLPHEISLMTTAGSDRVIAINKEANNAISIDTVKQKIINSIPVGSFPKGIIFNETTKKVYVANRGSNTISVIDPKTSRIVATLAVGENPTTLAYNKQSGDVFIAHIKNNTLSIIRADNSIKTINLPSFANNPAHLILLHQEKNHLLLAVNTLTQEFFLYNTTTLKLLKTGKTLVRPMGIIKSEAQGIFFIPHADADFLFMIDASGATMRIPEQVSQKEDYLSGPRALALASEMNKIFVANTGSGSIAVVDIATFKPIAKIAVNQAPTRLEFVGRTKKLYAISPSDNSVAVITADGERYATKIFPLAGVPINVKANQKTERVYIVSAGNSTVTVIDSATDNILSVIPLPSQSSPSILTINEDLNKIYVILSGKDSIAVIDGKTNTIERQIFIGKSPNWVRYMPSLKMILASNEIIRELIVTDARTNEVVQHLPVSGVPYRIFFDSRNNYVYVNFRNTINVAVFKPKANSFGLEYIRDIPLTYWGQADNNPYNIGVVDPVNHLAYFTSSRNNRIVVIKDNLDNEGIKNPFPHATILASGEVRFAQSQESPPITFPLYAYLGVGILIAAILIYVIISRKTPPRSQPVIS